MALVYDDTSVRPQFRGGTPISEWGSEKVMALWAGIPTLRRARARISAGRADVGRLVCE